MEANEPEPSLDRECEREREAVDFDFDREERCFLEDRCDAWEAEVDDEVEDENE